MKGLLIGFNIQESVFPLGLSYLKSYIENNDPETEIEIKEFAYGNRFSYDVNKNIELQAIAYILSKQPDFVAFSTYIWSIEIIQNIARAIKKSSTNKSNKKNDDKSDNNKANNKVKNSQSKDIKIIIGGVEANESSLTEDIDFIITGEGEESLYQLTKHLANNKNTKLENIPNLIYREKNSDKIIKTKIKVINEIDTIPFPYRIYNNKSPIKRSSAQSKSKFAAIRIETSRGCPYTCKYCHYAKRKVRNFSIEYLEKNIPYLFENFSFRNLTILDANFNIDTNRMKAILDIIKDSAKRYSTESNNISKHLNINFEIKPELFNKEQLKILESYPFQINLEMGLQSTNEKVLKDCKRPYDLQKVKETLNLLHNSKLKYNIDLMYGLPKDTFLSFLNSVKFILNNATMQNQIRAHHFMLLNNTDFYIESKANNLNRFNNTNSSMVTSTDSQNPIDIWRTKVFVDTTNKELDILYSK